MHNIEYFDYPENIKRDYVFSELSNYVAHEDWQEGCTGLYRPIRWLEGTVCEDYEAAKKFLERNDRRDYDNLAVRFKWYKYSGGSKAVTELEKRIRAQRDAIEKLNKDISIQNRTSSFIGCPKCGSSLARTLLHGENCPLCREDLRSKTNLTRLSNARQKLADIEKKRDEQIRKENKPEIRWLVKIEYHT